MTLPVEPPARCYLVSGRVQGVWYRQSTLELAQQLGLRGWVRNLADGRVEVVASGSEERLGQLERWLHRGPELARVEKVDVGPIQADIPTGFELRH